MNIQEMITLLTQAGQDESLLENIRKRGTPDAAAAFEGAIGPMKKIVWVLGKMGAPLNAQGLTEEQLRRLEEEMSDDDLHALLKLEPYTAILSAISADIKAENAHKESAMRASVKSELLEIKNTLRSMEEFRTLMRVSPPFGIEKELKLQSERLETILDELDRLRSSR